MVVDSSAVLAILFDEPDAEQYTLALEAAGDRRISAANYLEAAIVFDSRADAIAARRFDTFFKDSQIEIEPLTASHVRQARLAYRDFGKGRHKAGLNFGDCIAYALAKSLDEPLLYKGGDFGRTDVENALQA
jgi:ribonuclease VapC